MNEYGIDESKNEIIINVNLTDKSHGLFFSTIMNMSGYFSWRYNNLKRSQNSIDDSDNNGSDNNANEKIVEINENDKKIDMFYCEQRDFNNEGYDANTNLTDEKFNEYIKHNYAIKFTPKVCSEICKCIRYLAYCDKENDFYKKTREYFVNENDMFIPKCIYDNHKNKIEGQLINDMIDAYCELTGYLIEACSEIEKNPILVVNFRFKNLILDNFEEFNPEEYC